MRTRWMAVGLAGAVVGSMLLGGCGGNPAQTQTQNQTAAETAASKAEAGNEAQQEEKEEEAPAAVWEMKKEAEYVVPANPGGGSDISARVIAEIAQKNGFAEKNLMVVNKPGGACAVGYNYVGAKKGDPYTLLSLHSGNIVVSEVNGWEKKWDELTDVIAVMAFDDVTLCVKSDGPYQTIEELLNAAKENPGTLKFGSDQRGNTSQLGYELIKKYTGVDFNYVQFDSSGDVATALLGGHVDVGILNPCECISQVESGDFKPVVTFAPERITGDYFKDVPTFAEAGYPEVTFREYRGISGAKDMPGEAIGYYEDMAKKIVETDEWKKGYLEANSLTPAFMGHEEATQYIREDMEKVMDIFAEVGYFDEIK